MQIPGCTGGFDARRLEELDAEDREFFAFEAAFCLEILSRRPHYAEALQAAAHALTHLGFYEDGLRLDRRLFQIFPHDAMTVYNYACSLALTGDVDGSFGMLSRAIELGYCDADHMHDDPDLDNLRSDPRFLELLEHAHHVPGM